jgi:hypothetical protein
MGARGAGAERLIHLSPLPFYTAGVFAPHLAAAFGWKIGEILVYLLVTTLMIMWSGPVAGLLAVRRVALGSNTLFGLAFMLPALSTGSLALFYRRLARSSATLPRAPGSERCRRYRRASRRSFPPSEPMKVARR